MSGATATRRLCVLLLCAMTATASAEALGRKAGKPQGKDHPAKASTQAVRKATQLIEQGTQALASGDAAAAEQALSDAYRTAPSNDALYLLGKVAWTQGHKTAGRDFLRRFLVDPATEAESPQAVEAQRLLAEPPEPSGEVRVLGSPNAKVLVNDHIVGTLPLTLPLLLPVGTSKLTVESGTRKLEEQVKVTAGHGVELRFRSETGVVVVTVPPALAVLTDVPGAAAADLSALGSVIEQRVRHAKLDLFHWELAPGSQPDFAQCSQSLSCQRQLTSKQALDYVVTVRLRKGEADKPSRLIVTLVDPVVEEPAAQADLECGSCAGPQLVSATQEAITKVLTDGIGRPHGTLSIKSTPPGAEILLGERKLGVTPFSQPAWALRYQVALRHPGFLPQQAHVTVEDGKDAALDLTLEAIPPKPVPKPPVIEYEERILTKRHKRPLARLIVGGALIGIGAIGIGFGGDALYYNNQCSDPPGCTQHYATGGVGTALVVLGGASLISGIVVMAVRGSTYQEVVRTQRPVRAEPGSSKLKADSEK